VTQQTQRRRTTTLFRPGSLLIWLLMVADLVVLVWMHLFGSWLDETSPVTATATLGGHHVLVMIMAGIGFVTFVALTLLTGNTTRLSGRSLDMAKALGIIASLVALAGILALLLPAMLGRLFMGKLGT
jgi:hypothetical protein